MKGRCFKAVTRTARVVAPITLALFLATLPILGLGPFEVPTVKAAGALQVEIRAGYNLVVDSNVTSLSTCTPSVATVAGRFCNTGDADLVGVQGFIGDFSAGTPGIYPSRDSTQGAFIAEHPALANSGDYAFTHVGGRIGLADATRQIGTLAPGECSVQYWHLTYPRCENSETPPCSEDPVWGDSIKPDDDLWLEFDVWGTAPGSTDSATWRMTMRNEISAMANKIKPNPDGQWFNTKSDTIVPGEVITSNGILYELGVINQGFDNDGDYVPDYNAWLQPVGDPRYDPSCFRLVRTSGKITVTRSDGHPDLVIPFEDQLYFTNLPPDNMGTRGLVYYTFMALSGPCATALSPYQEVASGFDNEKFNGDYGTGIPPVGSTTPEVELDKSGDVTTTAGGWITYVLDFDNNSDSVDAGLPMYNMPLVVSDTIPAGTTYVNSSASVGTILLYSTDYGQTYTTIRPASGITTIQWWLTDALAAGTGGTINFTVQVDPAFPPPGSSPFIENCADLRFGGGTPFDEDCTGTLISGPNTIGDRVWRDENADGIQDAAEPGISDIQVSLYWDGNGSGQVDAGDPPIMTTNTGPAGYYAFDSLPDGDYLVQADSSDPDLPYGYRRTTTGLYAVVGLGTAIQSPYLKADFGFGPALQVQKTLVSGGPTREDGTLTYNISLINNLAGDGTREPASCSRSYVVWSSNHVAGGQSAWTNPERAFGDSELDGQFASSTFQKRHGRLRSTAFAVGAIPGTIQSVEAVYSVYMTGQLRTTQSQPDEVWANVYTDTTGALAASHRFDNATLNNTIQGSANQAVLSFDITSHRSSWTWADLGDYSVEFETQKRGAADGATMYVDAVGWRITVAQPCGGPEDTIATFPLTDTYDADLLEFVSAIPAESAAYTTTAPYPNTGVVSWNDLGPLYAGQTRVVTLTFTALEPPDTDSDGENDPATLTNTACVDGATFADGTPVNSDCDEITTTLNPAGSIGDSVWNDVDGNGSEDAGEAGIPGVTVRLYRWVGPVLELLDSTVTDGAGYYLFAGLGDDTYRVEVVAPTLPGSSFTQTGDPDEAGTCSTCDNWSENILLDNKDGDPSNDDIDVVNFGYQIPNTIYGSVWEDDDGDGTQDPGENGLALVTVDLYDGSCTLGTDCLTTITEITGSYVFSDLPDGDYQVFVVGSTLPPGGTWSQTVDPDEAGRCAVCDDQTTLSIAVSGGNVYGSYGFGYRQSGDYAIGDTVYVDWNSDGNQGVGEEGIADITLSLYEDNDGDGAIDTATEALITTTSTDGTGYYTFPDLPAGDYIVVVDENDADFPDNHAQTQDPDEAGVCSTCNGRGSATLGPTDPNVDFGYQPFGAGRIGGSVWRDIDGNGTQGPGETGIPNITVRLYEDGNGNDVYDAGVDALVMTTITEITGSYLLSGLRAGDYLVDIDTADSDLPTDGYGELYLLSTDNDPLAVTLSTGQEYLDADFGFTAGGQIGDYVWQDNNADGIQDPTEPGIANVTVLLYIYGTFVPYETTTTNPNGYYRFTSLPGDDYVVVVDVSTLPSGFIQTGDPDLTTVCSGGMCDSQSSLELAPAQIDMSRDFGYRPTRAIGDYVWLDANGDGVQDDNEQGIGGVVLSLTKPGSGIITTTTNSDGYYSFGGSDLDEDGTYSIAVDTNTLPSAQMAPTYDLDATLDHQTTLDISGGSTFIDMVDFGYWYNGAYNITGHVFFDDGGSDDGTNDTYVEGTDTPYSKITVYLWNSDDVLIVSTETDAGGAFTFTNLPGGGANYTISVNRDAPRLNGMDLTASPNAGYAYNTVTINNSDVDNQDFGFYESIDFGDLPDSYATQRSSEGAGHIIGDLYLGSLVDSELDGQPSADATGDGADDADGIQRFPNQAWNADNTVSITATVTGDDGYLVGFFDWNGDGNFDSGEMHVFGHTVAGANTFTFAVPGSAAPGNVLDARFRLYDVDEMSGISPTGLVTNGEIEDYQWPFEPNAVILTFLGAEAQVGGILVHWETGTEVDLAGFNLYRRPAGTAEYVRLNETLLPPEGPGSGLGHGYEFFDQEVVAGTTYEYLVETVHTGDLPGAHGPISATALYSAFFPVVRR